MSKNVITDIITNEWSRLKSYLTHHFRMLSEQDAEDIIQETAYRMLKSNRSYDGIDFMNAYVYQSIRNTAVSFFRSRKDSLPIHEFSIPAEVDIEDEILRKEVIEEIKEAVNELDSKSKAIWIATEMMGKSFRELAQEMDEPIGTLLSRKKRANDRLKEKILKNREKENV